MSSQRERGGNMLAQDTSLTDPPKQRKSRTHWLYIGVIVALFLGIIVGLVAQAVSGSTSNFATDMKPFGSIFIALIKMLIAPVIFCTIVTGIGAIKKAATIGKVGILALVYFFSITTFAMAIGLVVGNVIHPGEGLQVSEYSPSGATGGTGNAAFDFILSVIPPGIPPVPTLFVSILVGFALQSMGKKGEPILRGIATLQELIFKLLMMVMWVAPIASFGAIAAVVGATGFEAIKSLAILMVGFYIVCAVFIVVILGGLLYLVARVNIFKLMRYLGREYILIFATGSTEPVLPGLMKKLEHLGVAKPVVGVTVPAGYSFNMDGTAIYLTMATLFVSNAMGLPMTLGEQISFLIFMIIASKGAAGVAGAGLATLSAGLQTYKPELLDGLGVLVGIDRIMAEARGLTNFTGNAVAGVLMGTWTKGIDKEQVKQVLAGEKPYVENDEDSHDPPPPEEPARVESSVVGASR